jgi:DNA-binding Lrp family transcriptional regulator
MVKQEDKDKFIELRAAGMSFDSIAEKLDISKPTLLKLARELQADIERLKFINLESLAERYKVLRAERLQALGGIAEKVDTAIEAADFSKLSPEKLVELKLKLTEKMRDLLRGSFIIENDILSEVIEKDRAFELKVD